MRNAKLAVGVRSEDGFGTSTLWSGKMTAALQYPFSFSFDNKMALILPSGRKQGCQPDHVSQAELDQECPRTGRCTGKSVPCS